MTEKEAILLHLSLFVDSENPVRFTSFTAVLRDARGTTRRREPMTGKFDPKSMTGHVGSWLGTLGYLVGLDHIGHCFKPRNVPAVRTKRSLIAALKYFGQLEDKETKAIYALRCAFAHDYGLCNLHSDPELQHFFVVTGGSGRLLKFPDIPWNGEYEGASQHVTVVDLWELGELAESVFHQVVVLAEDDQVEIALDGGIQELQARYLLLSPLANYQKMSEPPSS